MIKSRGFESEVGGSEVPKAEGRWTHGGLGLTEQTSNSLLLVKSVDPQPEGLVRITDGKGEAVRKKGE